MCGLTGFLGGGNFKTQLESEHLLNNMTDAISHRGPDHDGFWNDINSSIGLGHRRLSILDLSSAGTQPMISKSGRYIVVFNGEIYNHFDLRSKLVDQKHVLEWRGHSDTETLLSCFDVWGVEESLKRSVGMFAFALWDREKRVLILGRDR